MRRLTVALTFLALSACNREEQAADTNGIDQNVAVEAIGGNDITAIDAATNDSANMAADVEVDLNAATFNEGEPGNVAAGNTATDDDEQ